jgi:hypothetical protein
MPSFQDACREALPKHLDKHGDLAPPWAEFPTFERFTIHWRMGFGESWLGMWSVFVDGLGDRDAREKYLRRHAPAPVPWADHVLFALGHDVDGDDVTDEQLKDLVGNGFVGSDVAFSTWRSTHRQDDFVWKLADTPSEAARHQARELWFQSRVIGEQRAFELPAEAPSDWRDCAAGKAAPSSGLKLLAQNLLRGRTIPPWEFRLSPADFADSFEDDMGYVDAFRLLLMCAFDDRAQLHRFLDPIPPEWQAFIDEQGPPR